MGLIFGTLKECHQSATTDGGLQLRQLSSNAIHNSKRKKKKEKKSDKYDVSKRRVYSNVGTREESNATILDAGGKWPGSRTRVPRWILTFNQRRVR
jgi:hypothetical protein